MSGTPVPDNTGRPGLQELRAQVEHSREELGRTVEELAARTDMKARAKRTATAAREQMAVKTGHAKEQVAAKTEHAREQMAVKTGHAKEQVSATVGTPRGKAASLAAGAAVVLLLMMLARRRRHG
ncbi:DUF3618 domain-containing protein [Streptomyces sp. NPDC018833]|uniref:DUF3618 domain-containing protein n=1 Tax=Streptomyces sp. NPDC018833 TaxID=3365053 RepID=UPI00379DCB37